ncbi:glycoside hydrolase [Corynascus novoguineensis]|uniref:alpha-1,2-Mannosidase n=1 Tax=Corynascus novoguineensis TaxID=1126955 RepID=A0AAN7CMX5_9PEZI|nr:glycoside hydrolase [Corynascus novoguineensis]
MAYVRGWPFCFLPARVRRSMALDRRLGRVLFVAALFMTVMLLLHPTRPHLYTDGTDVSRSPGSRPEVRFRASSFDWTTLAQHYPVSSIRPLPTGTPQPLHPVQHTFSDYVHDATTQGRQQAVRAAFVKSWRSYKKQAWLWDELAPVSGKGKNTFGGWAATLVDALDTLWIMGLMDDFYDAAAAAARLDWADTSDTAANLFETTIRHLAGLLSAYDLSGEPALLQKARELGDMLYMGFDTPNRMPGFWLNFEDAKQGRQIAGTNDPSASPCSLSLEFTRLSLLTGDPKYYDAIARITDFLERTQNESKLPGIWPKLINFREQSVDRESGFTLGALADSLYEYLPKMSALLGGQLPAYEKMYRAAMETSRQHMLFRPMVPDDDHAGKDVLFAGDAYVHQDRVDHIAEGQHLSCFAGGMFGLGGKLFDIPDHVAVGERLARGCAWAYDAFPTGLMPEIFTMVTCESLDGPCPWDEDKWEREGSKELPKGFKSARDTRYILRPEAIESVFLLYRMTGKEDLRDLAWRMFQSVMEATETRLANSAIADVTVQGKTTKMDSMESFWLAETLKYFYLIFSPPDLISLDEFVLNTEAHPFRRMRVGMESNAKSTQGAI